MNQSKLDEAASIFNSDAEDLHEKFLAISRDSSCARCRSAGFGEAILVAWLQNIWGKFTRALTVASATGTRRRLGTSIKPVKGVKTAADAEKMVRTAAAQAAATRGTNYPIWHDPAFVIDVGDVLGLKNLGRLELVLGATRVPKQITDYRNYLVHPGDRTRRKYEDLQAKLGMLDMEPEDLLHQFQSPGLTVFTSWVRELQRIADDSAR